MTEQRRRTSTPTITVFGKVVPNPAYLPDSDGTADPNSPYQVMTPHGPPPGESETLDRARVEELMGYFEYEDRIDTVDVANMVREIGQYDTQESRALLSDMAAIVPSADRNAPTGDLADAIVSELNKTTRITRSLEWGDDDVHAYVSEVGSIDNAKMFAVDGRLYYALP